MIERTWKKEPGFTLIEVLLSLCILTIGIMITFSLFHTSLRYMRLVETNVMLSYRR